VRASEERAFSGDVSAQIIMNFQFEKVAGLAVDLEDYLLYNNCAFEIIKL
jgi:hypothetical protein